MTVLCNSRVVTMVTEHGRATQLTYCVSVWYVCCVHKYHVLRCVWVLGMIVGSDIRYIAVCFYVSMTVSAVQV